MKRYLGLVLLVFVATAGWRIGGSLSADALSMAVGVLFGVMAGIPTALLVMASGRREPASSPESGRRRGDAYPMHGYPMLGGYPPPQPPVIVVAGPQHTQPLFGQHNPAFAGPNAGPAWGAADRSARSFKVVGEREEWVEDW
jgi:hypothetical protein